MRLLFLPLTNTIKLKITFRRTAVFLVSTQRLIFAQQKLVKQKQGYRHECRKKKGKKKKEGKKRAADALASILLYESSLRMLSFPTEHHIHYKMTHNADALLMKICPVTQRNISRIFCPELQNLRTFFARWSTEEVLKFDVTASFAMRVLYCLHFVPLPLIPFSLKSNCFVP